MVTGLQFEFPSRGFINVGKSASLLFTLPKLHVARQEKIRQSLPPTDGLIVLHAIRARRMTDLSCHQQDSSGKSQRKRSVVGSKGERASSDKRRRTSSTPNGLDHTVAPRQAPPGDCVSYGRVVFTADALGQKTLADLKDVCRSRGLSVRGNKEQLLQRILTSQLGPYIHGAEGP